LFQIQSNPAILPQVIQQFGATNPEVMQMIAQNPDEFLRILNGPAAGAPNANIVQSGGAPPQQLPPPQVIAVSEDDRAAIERVSICVPMTVFQLCYSDQAIGIFRDTSGGSVLCL